MRTFPRPSVLKTLLIAVALALVAAACSSDAFDTASDAVESVSDAAGNAASYDGDDSAEFAPAAAEAPMAPEAEFDAEDSMSEAGAADDARVASSESFTTGSVGSSGPSIQDLGRDIIFTASLDLGSTDVVAATREAIRTIEGLGGFLFSQDSHGGLPARSTLTFKILPEQFPTALERLGAIGDVRSQTISADDVTAVVVDLQSRISTAEASVDRLRDLLDDAADVEIISRLENQLLQRETTLEQLRGQLRSVQNQVDLATITVQITELLSRPAMSLSTTSYVGHDGGFDCLDRSGTGTIDAGEAVTICHRVTNNGDTQLTDIVLSDQQRSLSNSELIVVDGSIDVLEPGASVVLAEELLLDATTRFRTQATATALDLNGDPLADTVEAITRTLRIDVADDGMIGFGEMLSRSWDALKTIAIVVGLVLVAVAPFAAVALILGALALFVLRAIGRRPRGATTPGDAPPPPPVAAEDADSAGDTETGAEAGMMG